MAGESAGRAFLLSLRCNSKLHAHTHTEGSKPAEDDAKALENAKDRHRVVGD
jgi:hypothetical protein